jgi:hypothetical protein
LRRKTCAALRRIAPHGTRIFVELMEPTLPRMRRKKGKPSLRPSSAASGGRLSEAGDCHAGEARRASGANDFSICSLRDYGLCGVRRARAERTAFAAGRSGNFGTSQYLATRTFPPAAARYFRVLIVASSVPAGANFGRQ